MQLLGLLAVIAAISWSAGESPGQAAVALLILLAVVLVAVWRAIGRGLPREPWIEPYPDAEPLPATLRRCDELRALGFVSLGGPHVANLFPAPTVLPFVHRDAGVMAAVYELQVPAERTVLDLVTTFASGVMLTTASTREAGVLPLPPERFLQTRHGGSTADLFALHRDGIEALRAVGQQPASTKTISLAEILALMVATIRSQRAEFVRRPLLTTIRALVCVLFQRDPYRTPLAAQAALRRERDVLGRAEPRGQ